MRPPERFVPDLDAYHERAKNGPGFVCGIVGDDPNFAGHPLVYEVSEAVRAEVGAERMYVMSLGSNGGNAHVHWHVVPLPPGVPYEEQQFAALMLETAGALNIPDREMDAPARRVRERPKGALGES